MAGTLFNGKMVAPLPVLKGLFMQKILQFVRNIKRRNKLKKVLEKEKEWIISAGLNPYRFNWQAGVYVFEFVKGSLRKVKTIVIAR
jgi:hypothetical protein